MSNPTRCSGHVEIHSGPISGTAPNPTAADKVPEPCRYGQGKKKKKVHRWQAADESCILEVKLWQSEVSGYQLAIIFCMNTLDDILSILY